MADWKVNGTLVPISWCVLYRSFKPSEHTVKVGNEVVVKGTDRDIAFFSVSSQGHSLEGSCVAEMYMMDIKTKDTALYSSVPPEVRAACEISEAAGGLSGHFAMTSRCGKATGHGLGLIRVGLFPTMHGQACAIKSPDFTAFTGLFVYE